MIRYIGSDNYQVDVEGFSGVISKTSLFEIMDEMYNFEEVVHPNDAYNNGHEHGYSEGYSEGAEYASDEWNEGFDAGKQAGNEEAYEDFGRSRKKQDEDIIKKMKDLYKAVKGY